jgi:hypothetical protein
MWSQMKLLPSGAGNTWTNRMYFIIAGSSREKISIAMKPTTTHWHL